MSQASGSVLGSIRGLQNTIATVLQPFALLLARVIFGYGLYVAGRPKVGDDNAGVVGFFTEKLGMPEFMVYVTGYSEIILGWMLVVGLATRFASAGVLVIMSVAMLTAHTAELTSLSKLAGAGPVPYFVIALLIGAFGAGKLSVDHFLAKKLFGDQS